MQGEVSMQVEDMMLGLQDKQVDKYGRKGGGRLHDGVDIWGEWKFHWVKMEMAEVEMMEMAEVEVMVMAEVEAVRGMSLAVRMIQHKMYYPPCIQNQLCLCSQRTMSSF